MSPQMPDNLAVATHGYAVFHAAIGTETGFAVQLHTAGARNQPPIFDSRQLHDGDVFSTTLLRPGRYSLTNVTTGSTGQIQVAYPVISDKPYSPPDPLDVQVNAQGFQPNVIQLKPAQGLIFRIGNVTARIKIDLVEPDDGPTAGPSGQGRKPLYKWQKPAQPLS